MSYITYIHTYMFYLFGVLYNKKYINYFQITNIMNLRLVYPLTKHCFTFVYQVGSIKVSGKLPTYPSPKLTLTLTPHFGQNDGLSSIGRTGYSGFFGGNLIKVGGNKLTSLTS